MDFDLQAAQWRRDYSDEKAFVEALATRFSQALPYQTTVERTGFAFSKNRPVKLIRIQFDDEWYELHMEKGLGVRTELQKVVRGIRLSSDQLSFSHWLESLSAALQKYVEQHEDVRETAYRFLMS